MSEPAGSRRDDGRARHPCGSFEGSPLGDPYAPLLLEIFNQRKRSVLGKWHVDETYIKVRGRWMYLYRAIDKAGATVEFLFSPTRNPADAKRFFRKAYRRHGLPARVTINGSQTNLEAARVCHGETRINDRLDVPPLKVRRSQYMNNRIEQDHRRIKRRTWSVPGFKSPATASVILGGIELIHMIRKGHMNHGIRASMAEQFDRLAA